MNAEELKIVCDNHERRVTALEQDNKQLRDELQSLALEGVCVARGGHEYESVGMPGMRQKQCKYCGAFKDE